MYRNEHGDCRNLIVIVSPSDTGYQGRCNQPFENTGCLITPEEKKKCDDGLFCCYFSELFSEYQYFCHRDVWNRCVPNLAGDFQCQNNLKISTTTVTTPTEARVPN